MSQCSPPALGNDSRARNCTPLPSAGRPRVIRPSAPVRFRCLRRPSHEPLRCRRCGGAPAYKRAFHGSGLMDACFCGGRKFLGEGASGASTGLPAIVAERG
eukprot:11557291-Alexandrium_andersonii.AAC.1